MASEKNPGRPMHFYIVSSGFREKKHKGGGAIPNPKKNPGIDFYSGFKFFFMYTLQRKKTQGGGGAIRNPKKIQV